MNTVDIVVVNYKTTELTQRFVESYYRHKPQTPSELIVVDNSSDFLEQSWQEDFVYIDMEHNAGYAEACNAGAYLAGKEPSEYIGFFNNDTEFVDGDCIDTLVEYLNEHPDVGIVGPFQYDHLGKVTSAGKVGSWESYSERGWKSPVSPEYWDVQEVPFVSGSAFITRRSLWDELFQCPIYNEVFPDATGAFPPFKHFWEETLYAYHAYKHGYKSAYVGTAKMIHRWHQSSVVGSHGVDYANGKTAFEAFQESH